MSARDIILFEKFIRIGKCFFFPANSNEENYNVLTKVTIAFIITILWLHQVYFCSYIGYTKMIILIIIIYMIRGNSTFSVTYCLLIKILYKKEWKKLVKCINKLSKMYQKQNGNLYIFCIKCFIIFAWLSATICIEFLQTYVIFRSVGNIQVTYFLNRLVYFFMSIVICNILTIINEYIMFLNNLLYSYLTDPLLLTEEKMYKLKEIRKIYKLVVSSLKCFNVIFGWVIVFIFFATIFQILLCLNYSLMPNFRIWFIAPIVFKTSSYVVSYLKSISKKI